MNVIIKYGADTTQFEQGTDSVEQSIKQTTKSANDFSKTLTEGINNIAIGSMAKQFDALDRSIKEVSKDGKITAKELENIKKQANDVGKELGESVKKGDLLKLAKDAETATKQFTSLKAELRFLKQQISSGELEGVALQKATLRAAQLTDQLGDMNIKLKTLASDTRVFDTMLEGARLATGAFSVAQGAVALFGEENENLQKALIKLNAVMAISQGLQEIGTLTQKQTAIGKVIDTALTWGQTTAQTAYNVVVGTSVGVTKAFRLALAATGIGLLVFALYELITNFEKYNKILGLNIGNTQKLTEAEKTQLAIKESIKKVQDDALENSGKELSNVIRLGTAIKDQNLSYNDRLIAVREYNKIADEGNKIDETQINNTNLVTEAIERQYQAIINRANIKAAENEITRIAEESIKDRLYLIEVEKRANDEKLKKFTEYNLQTETLTGEQIKQQQQLAKANKLATQSIVDASKERVKSADEQIKALIRAFGIGTTDKVVEGKGLKIKIGVANDDNDITKLINDLEGLHLDKLMKESLNKSIPSLLSDIPVTTDEEQAQIEAELRSLMDKVNSVIKEGLTNDEVSNLLRKQVDEASKMIEDGNLQSAFKNLFTGITDIYDSIDEQGKAKILGIMQGALEMAQGVTNILDAVLEKQIANLDKLIDKQKDRVSKASDIAEKGNAVLLEAEETKLQRLEEMRKKEGEKQKALAITQAVIQTSLSVLQALASTAPPYSYILAAISAAAGAVQIGLISSQTFAKGGYTGDGTTRADETGERPVGIVHEKEFVFDRHTTAKNRSIFEYIHKNKINLNDMFKANQLGNFGGITIDKSIELSELKNEISELKQIMRGLPERMPSASLYIDESGFAGRVGRIVQEQSIIKNNIHA